MARSHKANRYVEATTNTSRRSGTFNALMAGAAMWGLFYIASPANEKPEDKTAKPNPVQSAFAKIPSLAPPAVPVGVPWDTQGVIPFKDAEIKAEDKKISDADGVIWEDENGRAVKPSIKGLSVAKKKDEDPVADSRAAAAAELNQLKQTAKAQPAPAVKQPIAQLQTERIVSDKIVVAATEPVITKSLKPHQAQKNITAPAARVTPVSYGALPKLAEVFKDGSRLYTVGPRKVVLKREVAEAIHEITALFHKFKKGAKLPPELLIATCAREGNCDPKAINENTKACGLFQFMPDLTLPRVAYNYGPVYGYPQTRDLVTQSVRNAEDVKRRGAKPIYDYHVKNYAAKKELEKLCLNPRFNAAMFIADKHYEVKHYEAWLKGKEPVGRDAVMGEVVILNNLGINYTKPFAERAWQDKANGTVTSARGFFNDLDPAIAVGNSSLVKEPDIYITLPNGKRHKHSTGRELSVQESWNKIISEYGGWGSARQAPASPQQLAASREL
ncbi:MAG: hypothetical protein DYH13_04880 [Alphaproteobacteria bacterium PRO2]|nr:hypothetical protein [Alphaproteobacteria bacterium PRO2]